MTQQERAELAVTNIRNEIASHLTFRDMSGASQFSMEQIEETVSGWAAIIGAAFMDLSEEKTERYVQRNHLQDLTGKPL